METIFVVMSNFAYSESTPLKAFKDKYDADDYAEELEQQNQGAFYYTVEEVEFE